MRDKQCGRPSPREVGLMDAAMEITDEWRSLMKRAPRYFAAVMASLCMGALASPVLAQSHNARESAIEKCELQAQKHYPYKGGDDSRDRVRMSTYKDCMAAAGQAP
jgi:hypothetical protein